MFSIRRLSGNPRSLPLRGFRQTRNVHFLNKKRWSNSATATPGATIENHVAFHGLPRHLAVATKAGVGKLPHDRRLHTNQHSSTLPALTLRDMCTCPQCIDPSTRQKLFSTAEILPEIEIKHIRESGDHLAITWENDFLRNKSHESIFSKDLIGRLLSTGSSKNLPALPQRRLWNDEEYRAEVPDLSYEAYMQDDAALYKALQTLQSHGMIFLEGVPEATESVARLAQRIGPLKNTFYGDTWDVRSVPNAKNVAYTSQDLGFHMDLLYMKQPPHLQLLHCIRSSTEGGASLFTDSFKAIKQLYEEDREDFATLQSRNTTFHYDHIDSHYYQQSRPLIELAPLRFGPHSFADFNSMTQAMAKDPARAWIKDSFRLEDYLEAVSWSPPFQAPYQLTGAEDRLPGKQNCAETLESTLRRWHAAARKFNEIIHKEENIYERTMKPGECVIFDNRRVLHARRAFEVADAGKERWLRGAYTDKDPFLSKLRVLANRYESRQEAPSQKAEAAAA